MGQEQRAASSRRDGSWRALRIVGPVLVVLALLGIVAVAATGSTPGGSGRSSTPADSLLDSVFSLLLLVFVVAFALVVYSAFRWREHEWSAPKKRNDLRAIATMLVFAFALALIIRERGLNLTLDPQGQAPLDRGEGSPPPPSLTGGSEPGYEFELAWLPILVVLVLAAVGAGGAVASGLILLAASSADEGTEANVLWILGFSGLTAASVLMMRVAARALRRQAGRIE